AQHCERCALPVELRPQRFPNFTACPAKVNRRLRLTEKTRRAATGSRLPAVRRTVRLSHLRRLITVVIANHSSLRERSVHGAGRFHYLCGYWPNPPPHDADRNQGGRE